MPLFMRAALFVEQWFSVFTYNENTTRTMKYLPM